MGGLRPPAPVRRRSRTRAARPAAPVGLRLGAAAPVSGPESASRRKDRAARRRFLPHPWPPVRGQRSSPTPAKTAATWGHRATPVPDCSRSASGPLAFTVVVTASPGPSVATAGPGHHHHPASRLSRARRRAVTVHTLDLSSCPYHARSASTAGAKGHGPCVAACSGGARAGELLFATVNPRRTLPVPGHYRAVTAPHPPGPAGGLLADKS